MSNKYNYGFDELKDGTILVCSWGYSMTIVNFYKVIGRKGTATVLLQGLENERVSGDGFSGECVPGNPVGEVFKVRYSSKHKCAKIDSHRWLPIWGGNPAYYNHLD